ncbi:response regulator transcription factor [Variovorax rhizosphaerae]|uniref:Response regulator transcription factor n=1 Tax=Variovorax rhizosphaerae TaxID=1836200 RepID=A0ABU8WS79_9BURK
MAAVRVFVVEDNPTILRNLVDTLREVARVDPVGTADSEAEAVHWLCSHADEWDLAIVDLFLKRGSGLSVLEACRDRNPSSKVVVLSNHASTDMRRRCMQLGADAVFDKASELDDLVDFCLRRREATHSMY